MQNFYNEIAAGFSYLAQILRSNLVGKFGYQVIHILTIIPLIVPEETQTSDAELQYTRWIDLNRASTIAQQWELINIPRGERVEFDESNIYFSVRGTSTFR